MPDGTSRFSYQGQPIFHYMGTSTFSEYTVLPEISLAKIPKDAPLDKVCLLGCGVTTGIGAVLNTAKVEEGASVAIFGLGGIGRRRSSVPPWPRPAESSPSISTRPNSRSPGNWAPPTSSTPRITPGRSEVIVEMTEGGVDYSFECIGNVQLMRAALECCHKGWGESVIIGVAGAGQEISTRPFQLVTGRVWRGSAFGGVKGRSELPSYVEKPARAKSRWRPSSPTPWAGRHHRAFDLMHEGRSIRTVIHFDR
jgi:S-(hydroxymethyl)glutathione dehydrogenase/alcohol dehydrogenase